MFTVICSIVLAVVVCSLIDLTINFFVWMFKG